MSYPVRTLTIMTGYVRRFTGRQDPAAQRHQVALPSMPTEWWETGA